LFPGLVLDVFSMENPFDLVVTLEIGTSRRVVTAREIAHELGDPSLAVRLVALALGSAVSPARAASEASAEAPRVTRNALEINTSTRTRYAADPVLESLTEPTVRDDDPERVAAHLASALRDEKSIAFFRIVARAVPREVIRDALTRALDAQNIRKSRSALFVHIVRPHLPRRSLTNHRTP
jgi:hypothetical protein